MKALMLIIHMSVLGLCVTGTYCSADHQIYWLGLLILNLYCNYLGLKFLKVI